MKNSRAQHARWHYQLLRGAPFPYAAVLSVVVISESQRVRCTQHERPAVGRIAVAMTTIDWMR